MGVGKVNLQPSTVHASQQMMRQQHAAKLNTAPDMHACCSAPLHTAFLLHQATTHAHCDVQRSGQPASIHTCLGCSPRLLRVLQ
jgi:hypothetical protein